MSSVTPRSLYRTLYRELARQHVAAAQIQNAQDQQKKEALKQYRERQGLESDNVNNSNMDQFRVWTYKTDTLRNVFSQSEASEANLLFGVEIAEYLKSQRTYKALLERYNPGANMDDEERVRLSARRVGLNLPEEPEDPSSRS